MQPELQRLAFNKKSATGQACGCGCRTSEGYGLTTLESHQPVEAPPANHLVFESCGIGSETLSLTEGQLIAPAKVEDVPDVKAGQPVIRMDSETGNSRCTVAVDIIAARIARAPEIEQVICVAQCFRVCIGCKEVQTVRQTSFRASAANRGSCCSLRLLRSWDSVPKSGKEPELEVGALL